MALNHHRVYRFGYTSYTRYSGNRNVPDEQEKLIWIEDSAAFNPRENEKSRNTPYMNSYGAHMGDILQDKFKYGNKDQTDAHIEQPSIKVFHQSVRTATRKGNSDQKKKYSLVRSHSQRKDKTVTGTVRTKTFNCLYSSKFYSNFKQCGKLRVDI